MKSRFVMLLAALACVVMLAVPAFAGGELTISAAASLTDAFNDVKAGFEADNPGVNLTMNYASSGALYRQIEQGAVVDVYASANPKWMNKAEEKKFAVPGTRHNFARNSLVLVTPADNPAGISGVSDLTGDKVGRISIGTPETVPAGQYAKGALVKMGLYDTLSSKYIFAESVRHVLDYVRRGEVDAGFIYGTDAVKGGDKVKIVQEIELEKPVTYPIAIMETCKDRALADKFLAFLASPKGMKLLEGRGFKQP